MTIVTYLGFQIKDGTVRPSFEKTKVVADFPTLINVHQAHMF